MAEQDLDRNQAATPHKLKRARERGQTAKSTDLVSAMVFTMAVVYMTWQGFDAVSAQFRFELALLLHAGRMDPSGATLWPMIDHGLRSTLLLMAPFLVAVMLAAVAGNMLQTGPILSLEPLKADFDRINPVNGLKRLFSMRVLFDAARMLVKLGLLSLVAFLGLEALTGQFCALPSLSPIGYLRTLLNDLAGPGLKMALILGLIALVDLMYTRHAFAKKMRMSQRELKDEAKQREGDPRIRARMGDVAYLTTNDLSTLRQLMALPMGTAPRPDSPALVDRETVERWVHAKTGLFAIRWAGPIEVEVESDSLQLPGDTVIDAARSALTRWLSERSLRAEVWPVSTARDLVLPAGKATGFYLPGEARYSPLDKPVQLPTGELQ